MQNEKTEYKTIPLKNIELSNSNPRYNNEWDPKENLIDFLIKGNQDYNFKKTSKDLLINDGDLTKFNELITSIKDDGFEEELDKIFVIKKNENEDKFIVAEGNRRILSLIMLKKKIKLPKIEEFKPFEGEDEEGEVENNDKLKRNYKAINKVINEYEKELNLEINVCVVKDHELLSKIINSRHSSGKVKGKRDWSTGKYYWTLYNYFLDKDNKEIKDDDEELKNISKKYNKTPKKIKIDLKNSNWIINLIKKSENNVGKFIKKFKISALHKNFIKSSLILDNYKNETNIFKFKKLIDAGLENQTKDFFNSEIFKKLSHLVIDLFTKEKYKKVENEKFNSISTRKTKHNDEAKNKIKEFFEIKKIIKEGQKSDKLKFKDFYQLNEKDLNKINWKNENDKKIMYKFISIKKNIEKFCEKIKIDEIGIKSKIKDSLIWMINILKNLFNNKDDYIPVIASTIRTIDEIIFFSIIERDKKYQIYLIDKKIEIKEKNNILHNKKEKIEKRKFLFDEKHREKRKSINSLKNKFIENFYENKKYEYETKNGNIVKWNLKNNTNVKDEINQLIHEPFNWNKENSDFAIKTINEINETISPLITFISGIYE